MTIDELTRDAPDLQVLLAQSGGNVGKLQIDPDTVEQDLARLVLGLMEFLRQLMELQAIRRMENGSLTEAEEERLGTTLMRAEEAIHEIASKFGLSPKDLCLDLGPLGKTTFSS